MKINNDLEKFPEHCKLSDVRDQSQAIGEFLEWLQTDQSIVLAKWSIVSSQEDELSPQHSSINDWLAKYFGIDMNKLEDEKRQMLVEIQDEAE